jgi:ribosomal protein L22
MEKEYAPTAKDKKMNMPKVNAPKIDNKKVEVKTEVKAEVKPTTTEHVHSEHEHSHEHGEHEHNHEHPHEHTHETPAEGKPAETKKESKKPVITKKDEAIALGSNISAGKKHCMYICKFIKGKPIDLAIMQLGEVIRLKRAIPMLGEIPHRKGKGMMSGRYPVDASKIFINILKALKGNVIVNGMDLDKTRIYFASASWASRPQRKGGVSAKRSNVILKAKEFNSKAKTENKK